MPLNDHKSHEWPLAIAVALLATLLYMPALRNGYVFDDRPAVLDNAVINEARWTEAVAGPYWPARPGASGGASNWRPLATLSFVVERRLAGRPDPLIQHATNVLLHGLVVLALFPLARRLAGRGWPAIAACALFAAHPAHTEAVAPVVGRTDLLAALGALVALECFLRFRDGSGGRWLALGAVAYAVGLGGKESAAPVLLLLPAADWLLCGRRIRELAGRPALAYLPYAAVAAVYLAARLAVLGESSFHHASAVDYGLGERLVFASRNTVVSLSLLVAPLRFHHMVTTLPADAPFTYPDPGGFVAAACVVAALAIGLGWLALVRRAPRAAFCWVAAVATWMPTSGLLPAAAGVSLRFLLLPTAFAACLVALLAARVEAARPRLRLAARAAVVVLVVAGGGLVLWRIPQWRNNETFFRAILAAQPLCQSAHYTLGTWYTTDRHFDLDKAREHYLQAVRITGRTKQSVNARLNLAISYELDREGNRYGPGSQLAEAERQYRRIFEIDPTRWEPHWNLAVVLDRAGRHDEAIEQYRRALELYPALADQPWAEDLLDKLPI